MGPEATPGVGNMISGRSETSIGEALHPREPAGQALIVAGLGLLVLYMTVGRAADGGPIQRLGAVGGYLLVFAGSMAVVNWMGRHYASMHPNAPLAVGIGVDL